VTSDSDGRRDRDRTRVGLPTADPGSRASSELTVPATLSPATHPSPSRRPIKR